MTEKLACDPCALIRAPETAARFSSRTRPWIDDRSVWICAWQSITPIRTIRDRARPPLNLTRRKQLSNSSIMILKVVFIMPEQYTMQSNTGVKSDRLVRLIREVDCPGSCKFPPKEG